MSKQNSQSDKSSTKKPKLKNVATSTIAEQIKKEGKYTSKKLSKDDPFYTLGFVIGGRSARSFPRIGSVVMSVPQPRKQSKKPKSD